MARKKGRRSTAAADETAGSKPSAAESRTPARLRSLALGAVLWLALLVRSWMDDLSAGGGSPRWAVYLLFLVVLPLIWLGGAWLATALDSTKADAGRVSGAAGQNLPPAMRLSLILAGQLAQVVAAVCLLSYVALLEVPGLIWGLIGFLCLIVTIIKLDDHGLLRRPRGRSTQDD